MPFNMYCVEHDPKAPRLLTHGDRKCLISLLIDSAATTTSSHLKSFADEYPGLIRLESLKKSHEGRDIWIIIITNAKTGPDSGKPAFWVDGNIHATEYLRPRHVSTF